MIFIVAFNTDSGPRFCGKCWDRLPPHRKCVLGPGGIPHEKTDHRIAEKIRSTLESRTTNEEQADLHIDDEITSWFGVASDVVGEYIFQDHGRYAALMSETLTHGTKGDQNPCYPSLVSVVGQTGQLTHQYQ